MAERFILNETSYFGRGCRSELPGEILRRGFKKVLIVTDKNIIECGIAQKIMDLLKKSKDTNIYAKYLLGYAYYVGFLVDTDYQKAFSYIKDGLERRL